MNQNLNTVLAAALELPPPQQRRLIEELRKRALPEKKKTGDVTKFFGTINSGDPNSADNDKIDADLAAAYADNHKSNSDIDLRTLGIDEAAAAELRSKFVAFEDWNDPEMDIYNDYDNAKSSLK